MKNTSVEIPALVRMKPGALALAIPSPKSPLCLIGSWRFRPVALW